MLATEPVRMIARVHDRSHWRATLSADPIVDAVSGKRHCQSFGVDNRERAITRNGGHSAAVLIAIAASSTDPVADRLNPLRFRRPPPAANHRGRRRGFRQTTFRLRT